MITRGRQAFPRLGGLKNTWFSYKQRSPLKNLKGFRNRGDWDQPSFNPKVLAPSATIGGVSPRHDAPRQSVFSQSKWQAKWWDRGLWWNGTVGKNLYKKLWGWDGLETVDVTNQHHSMEPTLQVTVSTRKRHANGQENCAVAEKKSNVRLL